MNNNWYLIFYIALWILLIALFIFGIGVTIYGIQQCGFWEAMLYGKNLGWALLSGACG